MRIPEPSVDSSCIDDRGITWKRNPVLTQGVFNIANSKRILVGAAARTEGIVALSARREEAI